MRLYAATAVALIAVAPWLMPPAVAHTTVAKTQPKSGAVLEQSPPLIEITFEHAARLTSIVLHQKDKPERKLDFTPIGSSMTFTVSNPQLVPGRNEIRWKALSDDGHAISGTLVYVIQPAAKTQ